MKILYDILSHPSGSIVMDSYYLEMLRKILSNKTYMEKCRRREMEEMEIMSFQFMASLAIPAFDNHTAEMRIQKRKNQEDARRLHKRR